jgi:putative transposase
MKYYIGVTSSHRTNRCCDYPVVEWQSRPMAGIYLIIYFDFLMIKSARTGIIKPIYLALGLNMDGRKELLGLWLFENEILNSGWECCPNSRTGASTTFIMCVDGLKGFPVAWSTGYAIR